MSILKKELVITISLIVLFPSLQTMAQTTIPEEYVTKKMMKMNLNGFIQDRNDLKLYDNSNLNKVNFYQILSVSSESLDSTGLTDVSDTLNHYISVAHEYALKMNKTTVTLMLPQGEYFIQKPIYMKSRVVLKGKSISSTQLKCETGENKHCIIFSPANMGLSTSPRDTLHLSKDVLHGEIDISLKGHEASKYLHDSTFLAGLVNLNDTHLVSSSWARGTVKELFEFRKPFIKNSNHAVRNHVGTKEDLPTELTYRAKSFELDYQQDKSVVLIYNSIRNSGLQCLSIRRMDTTQSQTSNIFMQNATSCHVLAVESRNCNFSHITLNNSNFNLVKRCIITEGNNYGEGGKAYGVTLQQSSTNNTVVDNVLSNLRHSILFQSGANGNIILANFSHKPIWNQVGFPSDAAGDIVFHGNYPFGNLIESNVAQQIVFDSSHGRNGPNNIIHRNWLQGYGIFMTPNTGSNHQVFTGNEITNTDSLKGQYVLQDSGHYKYGNRVRASLEPPMSSGQLTPSLLVSIYEHATIRRVFPPVPISFLDFRSPPFGEPFNQGDKTIPALVRGQTEPNCYELDDYHTTSTKTIHPNTILNDFIYPNPSNGKVKVRMAGLLEVYDLQGKKVHEVQVVEGGTLRLELRGLFVVKLTGKGQSLHQKILIY